MKGLWKQAILLGAVGFAAGLMVAGGFRLMGGGTPDSFMGVRGSGATVLYFLYSGLYGAACMGGSVVYSIERWGVARCTLTHLAISMTGYLILWLGLGWPGRGGASFLIMLPIMLGIYFIIWLSCYLAYRRKIRRLNEELSKWKSQKGRNDRSAP